MTSNTKKTIDIAKFQRTPVDTGSSEVQVAFFSAKINELSAHLQLHKNDLHSRRGLIKAVSTRRKLLNYLKNNDYLSYIKLIQELGLRK